MIWRIDRAARALSDCWLRSVGFRSRPAKAKKRERERLVDAWLDGAYGDPVELAEGRQGRGRDAAALNALLTQARTLAARRRFIHWQPAYPGVWDTWTGPTPHGGFDAVIGNPPYVRQEQLAAIKPALKARYAAYDGVADLYVYFFEQALRLLRPGGRFAFTVTNKWLKAGYAEELRGLLARACMAGECYRFWPCARIFSRHRRLSFGSLCEPTTAGSGYAGTSAGDGGTARSRAHFRRWRYRLPRRLFSCRLLHLVARRGC